MPAQLTTWSRLEPRAQEAIAGACAASFARGGLVVLPTDTVYGLAAAAPGLDRLRAAILSRASTWMGDIEPEFTWHAPSTDAVRRLVRLPTAVHRQLIGRLLPGPFRFVIELEPDAALPEDYAPMSVSAEGSTWIAFRVPASAAAQRVLAAAGAPVVAVDLALAEFGGPNSARIGIEDLTPEAAASGVEQVIADGPSPGGSRATTVRLALGGAFTVSPSGGVGEETVLSALRRRVLFVCTGNTCRSPMAAAIAEHLLAGRAEDGVAIEVQSAGVAAGPGQGATPEAVEAAGRFGGQLRDHQSRPVTRAMLREADLIYTMTEGHRAALRSIDARAADRAQTLDPNGDVPDPIGGPLSTYISTAERLAGLIRSRMQEIEP